MFQSEKISRVSTLRTISPFWGESGGLLKARWPECFGRYRLQVMKAPSIFWSLRMIPLDLSHRDYHNHVSVAAGGRGEDILCVLSLYGRNVRWKDITTGGREYSWESQQRNHDGRRGENALKSKSWCSALLPFKICIQTGLLWTCSQTKTTTGVKICTTLTLSLHL